MLSNNLTQALAIVLMAAFGIIATFRLATGQPIPEGYTPYLAALVAMVGVPQAALAARRYALARAGAKPQEVRDAV